MGSINDFLGNVWTFEECLGCSIANGEIKIPGGIIYNGNAAILGADPEVPIPGFLIITSKRHVNSFSQYNKDERHEICDMMYHAEMALKELKVADTFLIVQEDYSRHFHIWIFPRYSWMDEKFDKGVSNIREIIKYAKENATTKDKEEIIKIAESVRNYFANHNINE